ncbi:bifunctional phosphoribosyl-AMP cyclohydrolase/phosphoribosyl-ATP diphosphatase HisIE [Candidatus Bathyarchaeota archaeon]|nr:bifunctional phosphoribosyl-AMP cyclohydrolase/phosphoribosyl-ATP diphosphatase HisIE [Candidatus Bathyarchaeota archaeon]
MADRVDFEKGGGLVPAIVQDASNGKVLMQAYMNREALILTLTTGKTHFWSRTRRRLWLKGEESGHYSLVQNLILDCDSDSILIQVQQVGPCCHTGRDSCFHNPIIEMGEAGPDASILYRIYEIILERIRTGDNKSYVKNLVNEGEDAILKKIGEESTEVILAAKGRLGTIVSEVTDLIFHIIILLASKKIDLKELFEEFDSRHREKTSIN